MADDTNLNINIGANPSGVEAGSKRAKAAIGGVQNEAKQLEQSFRRIKSAIDPTFQITDKYNRLLADSKALLDANIIKKREHTAQTKALKAALEQELAVHQRNTAAGRAAAAEARASKQQEAAAAREAAAATRNAAREKAQAERQAAREAAAAVREKAREEREAVRLAAREAAAAAREKARAEKEAAREAKEAVKQAKREERQAIRDAAAAAKAAAAERRTAERNSARAAREAAAAVEEQARAERQAAAAARDLRASIDPAYAAQQRYNETMRTATQLLMQNKLRQGEWNAIQRQAKAAMDVNIRSMGRQNAMYVQLGYQAQDVTASLASGINPLVILAQQGGQTAAAMAGMGGTIGRVASFLAGPWGAAIIGFTLLLGYLWQSEEEGKKKTIDLKNEEERRKATVQALTAALRDYIAAQRESNNTQQRGLVLTTAARMQDEAKLRADLKTATEDLAKAEQKLAEARALPNVGKAAMEFRAGMISAASAQVEAARKKVADAEKGVATAVEATTEAMAAQAQAKAEMTAADTAHQKAQQAALETWRKSAHTAKDYTNYVDALRKANDDYTAAKARESDARRTNEKAAKEEAKAIFQSREAAIGVAGRELRSQGFLVGENNQFGGVTGGHANNADHAKYAIDVNIPGHGPGNTEASDAAARRKMDQVAKSYQARGFRVLWNGKVYAPFGNGPTADIVVKAGAKGDALHQSHMDIKAPASIVGQPAGKGLANQLISEANQVANEQRRLEQEALQDAVAGMEFRKELAADDLAQVLAIQDEKITAIKKFYGEDSKEALDAQREKIRIERQQQQESLRISQETIQRKVQIATAEADLMASIADTRRAQEEDLLNYGVENGLVGQRAALEEKRRILDQEYQDEVRHENAIYQLKANAVRDQLQLSNLTLEARRRLLADLELLEAEHNNRMTSLATNQARQVQQINLQSATLSNQVWKESAQTLTQSMNSTFQQLWTRSITWQQALINMGDQLVYKWAEMGFKMVEKWAMQLGVKLGLVQANEAAQTATHAAGEATRTGISATGEATRTGIGTAGVAVHAGQQLAKTGATATAEAVQTGAKVAGEATRGTVGAAGAITEIGARAATSAAGAFSSTVVIPFIGPVAAPVAAAGALAAVLGFAALVSSRGGLGEVGFDGQPAILHKKETVLPAWIAEPMRQMFVANRGNSAAMFGGAAAAGAAARSEYNSNSSAANFYYQPNHHNMGASFDTLLKKDGATLRKWFRNQVRNGGITV